jgi:hypothetical protein
VGKTFGELNLTQSSRELRDATAFPLFKKIPLFSLSSQKASPPSRQNKIKVSRRVGAAQVDRYFPPTRRYARLHDIMAKPAGW